MFVGPLSFAGVTGERVYTRLLTADGLAPHIDLADEADLVMVAPATADFIARAAQGRADDLLAAILLATRAPVVLAPAMNDRMYAHPQTQANLARCRDALGYRLVGPAVGPLAAGEGEGPGRMLEPGALLRPRGPGPRGGTGLPRQIRARYRRGPRGRRWIRYAIWGTARRAAWASPSPGRPGSEGPK